MQRSSAYVKKLVRQIREKNTKLQSRIEALEGQVERVRGCQRYRVDYHPMAGGTETTDNPDGPYMKADDVLKALAPEKDDG